MVLIYFVHVSSKSPKTLFLYNVIGTTLSYTGWLQKAVTC